MRMIKPQKLAVLHRTYENDRTCRFVPTLALLFSFDHPDVPLAEVALWKLVAEEMGLETVLDEGMPKARGELLVTGNAYPPGAPAPVCEVRVQLRSIDKRIYVIGDRRWHHGVATEPTPYGMLPIRWDRAYGGEGFDANPVGRGRAPQHDGASGGQIHRLPNIERPEHLIQSPTEAPEPIGLGGLDSTWAPRAGKRGSYDHVWLQTLYPGLAADIDWSYFNVAQADQWIDGFFEPGEAFSLVHMHPDEPRLASRLPALMARCFIVRRDKPASIEEVPLRIDTVHLLPHIKRGIVIFRGVTEVLEDDAADLTHVMAACDSADHPRPLAHYQQVLTQRLDKKRRHLHAMTDSELLPPTVDPSPSEPPGETSSLLAKGGFRKNNLRRREAQELSELRDKMKREGLDPDAHGVPAELPPALEPPSLEELPDFVRQQREEAAAAKQQADEKLEQALAEARRHAEEQGVDFEEKLRAAKADAAGPPAFRAEAVLEQLEAQVELGRNAGMPFLELESKLREPTFAEQLAETEARLRDGYRRFAHRFPAAVVSSHDERTALRAEVERALKAGEKLDGRDLTGADLSGLDLRGASLVGAFLEGASLKGADGRGANLENAVLTRADLGDANLQGATLRGVNFGEAKLHGSDLSGGIDLTGAILTKASLRDVKLNDAQLDDAELSHTTVRDSDLSGIRATNLRILHGSFDNVRLSSARLHKCVLFRVSLANVDFTRASLGGTALVSASTEAVCFERADCSNLRAVKNTVLRGASFRHANLVGANLRGTDLREADLREADLSRADVSEADLTKAELTGAIARKALMTRARLEGAQLSRTDLMDAVLQKADLRGADLRAANLFRADLAKVKRDENTNVEGANLKHVRFVERRDG